MLLLLLSNLQPSWDTDSSALFNPPATEKFGHAHFREALTFSAPELPGWDFISLLFFIRDLPLQVCGWYSGADYLFIKH